MLLSTSFSTSNILYLTQLHIRPPRGRFEHDSGSAARGRVSEASVSSSCSSSQQDTAAESSGREAEAGGSCRSFLPEFPQTSGGNGSDARAPPPSLPPNRPGRTHQTRALLRGRRAAGRVVSVQVLPSVGGVVARDVSTAIAARGGTSTAKTHTSVHWGTLTPRDH